MNSITPRKLLVDLLLVGSPTPNPKGYLQPKLLYLEPTLVHQSISIRLLTQVVSSVPLGFVYQVPEELSRGRYRTRIRSILSLALYDELRKPGIG